MHNVLIRECKVTWPCLEQVDIMEYLGILQTWLAMSFPIVRVVVTI